MMARTSPVPTESPAATRISAIVPAALGVDVVLHLHRLEHEDRLADLHGRADLDEHRHDGALHRCRDRSVADVGARAAARQLGPAASREPRAPPAGARRQPHAHREAAAVDLDRAPCARRDRRRSRRRVRQRLGAATAEPRTATGRPRPRPTWWSGGRRGSRRARAAPCARGSSCARLRSRTRRARAASARSRDRDRVPTRSACRRGCRSTARSRRPRCSRRPSARRVPTARASA